MILRVLQGPYVGELREFPTHIGKNLLAQKMVEIPAQREVDEWEVALEAGEPPPMPQVLEAAVRPARGKARAK